MGESSSVKLFSEEEGKMIREYHRFVEERGRDVKNKWVEFHSFSSFKQRYKKTQISEKMRRLETKFLKMKMSSSPPQDPLQAHIFQLCQSLWGKPKPPKSHTHILPNESLQLRELYLFCENKSLRLKESQLDYDKLQAELNHRAQYRYQSQSSKKRKVSGQLLLGTPIALDYDMNENNGDQQSDKSAKSKDDNKRNLQNVDGLMDDGISINEDNDAIDDLSIDYPEVKCENEQLFGGAKKDDVVDDEVEKTLPTNDVVIKEELVVGNTNKKLATKGAMVKVHFTSKVKGSDRAFDSSLDKDPYIICLGSKELIEGLSNGIEGMRVGGKRRLTIPPSLGYGDKGYGEIVPPNSWLEYEVELVGVKY